MTPLDSLCRSVFFLGPAYARYCKCNQHLFPLRNSPQQATSCAHTRDENDFQRVDDVIFRRRFGGFFCVPFAAVISVPLPCGYFGSGNLFLPHIATNNSHDMIFNMIVCDVLFSFLCSFIPLLFYKPLPRRCSLLFHTQFHRFKLRSIFILCYCQRFKAEIRHIDMNSVGAATPVSIYEMSKCTKSKSHSKCNFQLVDMRMCPVGMDRIKFLAFVAKRWIPTHHSARLRVYIICA